MKPEDHSPDVICAGCGRPLAERRTLGRSLLVAVLMAISGLYLLNPGAGLFELIPDAVPVVGNLDEAAAVLLLFNGLRYFGLADWWAWPARR